MKQHIESHRTSLPILCHVTRVVKTCNIMYTVRSIELTQGRQMMENAT